MSGRFWIAAALLAAALAACAEDLTVPGQCPDLCLGGTPRMEEIVVPVVASSDTTFFGFAGLGEVSALLVSNAIAAGEARAWYQFAARPDSVFVQEQWMPYTADSVVIALGLVARDTALSGLVLYLHRIPYTVDTLSGFAFVESAMTPATLIDSIVVPDTLRRGPVRALLTGEAVARLQLTEADSGRLAIGVRMRAAAPSGVRIGSLISSTGAALMTTYARVAVTDTVQQRQTITTATLTNGWVTRTPTVHHPDLLYLGGAPSGRTVLRFAVPKAIIDSTSLVRATLELVPAAPLHGLPTDPAAIEVRGVTADLGAKSTPIFTFLQSRALPVGTRDTVRIEVFGLVQLWASATGIPQTLYLSLAPEAGSFHEPVFFSSRSGQGTPRLRITYLRPAPVERP